MSLFLITSYFFFFNDTATTEIYTLSLHDALPISRPPGLSATLHPPARSRSVLGREKFIKIVNCKMGCTGKRQNSGPQRMRDAHPCCLCRAQFFGNIRDKKNFFRCQSKKHRNFPVGRCFALWPD